jgi:hypothetical protein
MGAGLAQANQPRPSRGARLLGSGQIAAWPPREARVCDLQARTHAVRPVSQSVLRCVTLCEDVPSCVKWSGAYAVRLHAHTVLRVRFVCYGHMLCCTHVLYAHASIHACVMCRWRIMCIVHIMLHRVHRVHRAHHAHRAHRVRSAHCVHRAHRVHCVSP